MVEVAFPIFSSCGVFTSDERGNKLFGTCCKTLRNIDAVFELFKIIIAKVMQEKDLNGFQLSYSEEEAEGYKRLFLSDLFPSHSIICRALSINCLCPRRKSSWTPTYHLKISMKPIQPLFQDLAPPECSQIWTVG